MTSTTAPLSIAVAGTTAAGLGPRLAARVVDAGLLAAVGLAVGAVTGFGFGWFAFQLVLVVGYLLGSDVVLGKTVGKRLLGLRIVTADGTRPSVAQAARREAFAMAGAVPFVGPVLGPLAWAVIAWSIHTDPDAEGRHDRWAGTRVVSSR